MSLSCSSLFGSEIIKTPQIIPKIQIKKKNIDVPNIVIVFFIEGNDITITNKKIQFAIKQTEFAAGRISDSNVSETMNQQIVPIP
ncbi:hypothetical protein M9Y10_006468 [Tritrichomonas musculus]|uniref:Uncharacterized protein n=1 Tax=Tritrichomonas musculus TaxID=1915356 RepID=A0ABR2JFD9_9EUKA